MKQIKIDKNKFYSGKAVADMGITPWTRMTFYRLLNTPKWNAIFKPIADKKAILTRYSIKGENILHYIELQKRGKLNNNEN